MLLGITFSAPTDLKTWRNETGLTTDLLCDADRAVALAYGAAETVEQERPSRLSVLVDPDGTIVKVYVKPDPGTHAAEVIKDLG